MNQPLPCRKPLKLEVWWYDPISTNPPDRGWVETPLEQLKPGSIFRQESEYGRLYYGQAINHPQRYKDGDWGVNCNLDWGPVVGDVVKIVLPGSWTDGLLGEVVTVGSRHSWDWDIPELPLYVIMFCSGAFARAFTSNPLPSIALYSVEMRRANSLEQEEYRRVKKAISATTDPERPAALVGPG